MEEKEIDFEDLFHFINTHEGEFFVRVILNEEGEFHGESDGCGYDKNDKKFIYHV